MSYTKWVRTHGNYVRDMIKYHYNIKMRTDFKISINSLKFKLKVLKLKEVPYDDFGTD